MPFSPHFPVQSSQGNINPDKKDVKENQKSHLVGENASPAAERPEKAKNQSDVCLVKEKLMKNNRHKPRNPGRIAARRREAEEVSRPRRSASGVG